jgi:hypothetical protein
MKMNVRFNFKREDTDQGVTYIAESKSFVAAVTPVKNFWVASLADAAKTIELTGAGFTSAGKAKRWLRRMVETHIREYIK